MNENAILTQAELEQQGIEITEEAKASSIESPIPEIVPAEPQIKKSIDRIFECPFALFGESNISIDHLFEGQWNKYQLKLKDKRYTVPADMDSIEKRKLIAALEKEGFRDVTVSNAPAPFVPEQGDLVYRMRHPEYKDVNKLNGGIGLLLVGDDEQPMLDSEGKQITKNVQMINGIITTDDKLVYEALLKEGFYGGGSPKEEVQ